VARVPGFAGRRESDLAQKNGSLETGLSKLSRYPREGERARAINEDWTDTDDGSSGLRSGPVDCYGYSSQT
jgi:hypothetical protein